MADFLEIEESELFDVHDEFDDAPLAKNEKVTAVESNAEENAAHHAGSESDEDTDFICDEVDDREHGIPTPSAPDNTTCHVSDFSTSTGGVSEVGSLKRFDSLGHHGGRPFGSEGDLALGASAPIRALMLPPSRSVTPGPDTSNAYLGTSMPIRIPMMQRRGFGASPSSLEGRAATFIPPHLLEAHADAFAKAGDSLALSPSAAIKREKLIARNAILRSTGFIEIQSFAAPVGEVIDAVKESIQPPAAADGMNIPKRHRPTSSLSALLSSSK